MLMPAAKEQLHHIPKNFTAKTVNGELEPRTRQRLLGHGCWGVARRYWPCWCTHLRTAARVHAPLGGAAVGALLGRVPRKPQRTVTGRTRRRPSTPWSWNRRWSWCGKTLARSSPTWSIRAQFDHQGQRRADTPLHWQLRQPGPPRVYGVTPPEMDTAWSAVQVW